MAKKSKKSKGSVVHVHGYHVPAHTRKRPKK